MNKANFVKLIFQPADVGATGGKTLLLVIGQPSFDSILLKVNNMVSKLKIKNVNLIIIIGIVFYTYKINF